MEMSSVYDSCIQSWSRQKVYRFAEGSRASCGEGVEILIASIEMFSCIRHGLRWYSLRSPSKKTISCWESWLKTGVSRITAEPYLTQVAAEARSPWGPSLLSTKLAIEAYSLTVPVSVTWITAALEPSMRPPWPEQWTGTMTASPLWWSSCLQQYSKAETHSVTDNNLDFLGDRSDFPVLTPLGLQKQNQSP